MQIVRKTAKFVPPDEIDTMDDLIASVHEKKAYVLSDKGFRDTFPKNWQIIRDVALKWVEKIVARSNHLHTEEDLDKYYDEMMCLSWADIARNTGKKKVTDVINTIYEPKYRDMYLKTVFGGQ